MRHQLPAYSPLTLPGIVRAAGRAALTPRRALPEFGADLANRFGAREVLLFDSGTHALQMAIRATLGRLPPVRRCVALPAYSCFDLATAVVAEGAAVRFYDVDPVSLSPEMSGLGQALADGAGVVVAANLYGFPLDWDALRRLSGDAGAVLVEDAAQGLGSRWGSREGGTFGDFTVLSFGRGKGWTGGGGGALLARGAAIEILEATNLTAPAKAAPGAITAILAVAQWALGRPGLYGIPSALPGLGLGQTRYREPSPPGAMSAFEAATLAVHGDLARDEVQRRRRNAERWLARIESECPSAVGSLCRPDAGGDASFLRLPLLAPDGGVADALATRGRKLGLARGYPAALPDLTQIDPLNRSRNDSFPGARALSSRLVTLPTHSGLRDGDVDRSCALLRAETSSHR